VYLINLRHGPHRKHRLYYCIVFSARCVATSEAWTTENTPFLSILRIRSLEMCLPVNYPAPVVSCALVGTYLPSNGVSWLHSLMLLADLSQYISFRHETRRWVMLPRKLKKNFWAWGHHAIFFGMRLRYLGVSLCFFRFQGMTSLRSRGMVLAEARLLWPEESQWCKMRLQYVAC
jgi:hypothetical protein